MVGAGNEVFRAGRFADEHPAIVVLFEDFVQLINLPIHRVGGNNVFRGNQHQLVFVALEFAEDFVRHDAFGNTRAQQRVNRQHLLHAIDFRHFVRHSDDVLLRHVRIDQHKVVRGHVKGFGQLRVRLHAFQLLRQAGGHVVILADVVVAVECRDAQHNQDDEQHLVVLRDELADARNAGQQRLVRGLFQRAVKDADDAGQQDDRAQYAEDNALAHHDAEVTAEREAHEADGDEARDRRQAAADDGGNGLADSACHRFVLVRIGLLLFLVAVPQKDGIVQRHAQLQHGGDCFGDVGNLTEEVVRAHVPQNAHADAQQEDKRQEDGVHCQHQHDAAQRNGDGDVDGFLILHQLLGIGHNRRQTGHEALLPRNFADLRNGFHRPFRRRRIIEEHRHQPRVALLEDVPVFVRQNLGRNRALGDGRIADDRIHMRHVADGVLQRLLVGFAHPFRDAQGERALAELFHQDVLPLDRVKVFRQIIQQVILDLCGVHAQHRRNQHQQTDDDDGNTVLDNPPCESVHNSSSFSEIHNF